MRAALVNILGSQALSQLAIVAATPLLTRLYSQQQFGVLGVGTTFALLLATWLTLKLEHSMHTVEDPDWLLSAILRTVSEIFVWLGLPLAFAASLFTGPWKASLVLGFALGVALTTVNLIALNRAGRFRAIAATQLSIPAVFLSGAFMASSLGDLLLWQTLGWLSGAAVSGWLLGPRWRCGDRSNMRLAIRQERGNLHYLVPSHLASILALNASVLGSALLYDATVAGLLVVAQRVARMPVTMVGLSLNEVTRAHIPEPGKLRSAFVRVSLIAVSASLGMLVIIAALPETTYGWVLGESWNGLKPYLLLTAVAAAAQLLATSVVSLLTAWAKRSDLLFNSLQLVGAVAACLIAWLGSLSPLNYLLLQSGVGAVLYLAAYATSLRVMQNRLARQRQPT